MTKTNSKFEKKVQGFDFNKELDNVSAKLKEESEKATQQGPSQPTLVKPEIQPNDKVVFNGKNATVISTWPKSDEIIILCDGMTIECSKKQVSLVGKVDSLDVPMKFKDGLPVDEQMYVRCSLENDSSPLNLVSENLFVEFSEWKRKKGKQRVRVINEQGEITAVPKMDVSVVGLPDEEKVDGYVRGVMVNPNGEPVRKCLVNAVDYTSAEDEMSNVRVMFYSEEGFKEGDVPKKMLKTLAV